MKFLTQVSATAALALIGSYAAAQSVNAVSYGSLSGTLVDFESLAAPDPNGNLIDGLLSLSNIQFGERFDGQLLSVTKAPRPGEIAQDWFDDLSFGSPTSGLTLLAGSSGANLGVYDYGDADGKALAGIGPQNPDGSDPFGSGAISARFASGQSALGFEVRDGDGGNAWLRLYRADGSLIQTVTLSGVQSGYYAFARSGGEADIAGFSLYNADSYYGIAIDQLVVGAVSTVPEPHSAWLLLLGLAFCPVIFKNRRQA